MLFATEIPPMVIPGAKLWVDASQMPLGAVASWTDLSGNNNHLTQATGGQQPVNTAAQQGGKPTLIFTGANSSSLVIPSGLWLIPNANNTFIAVAKRNVASGNQQIFNMQVGALAANSAYKVLFANTAGNIIYQSRNNNSVGVASTGNTTTNYNIIVGFRSGTTQSVAVNNGTAVTNTSAADTATVDRGAVGATADGTEFLTGGIAEMMIYPYTLSTAQILYLVKYLSNKWGKAIS
jgi:hypothetical protein